MSDDGFKTAMQRYLTKERTDEQILAFLAGYNACAFDSLVNRADELERHFAKRDLFVGNPEVRNGR